MADTTAIQWTDHTHNPWWGCDEVSPACDHCYARTLAHRFGWGWGATAPRRIWPHDSLHWQKPHQWNRAAARAGTPRRVFTASMADILDISQDPRDPTTLGRHDPPPWNLDAERAYLWHTIEATPWLDWQLLTKRPEQYHRLVPTAWLQTWPAHVWVGVTTETAEQAALRWVWIIDLVERCQVRPPVLFASAEPILSAIDFTALRPLTVERVTQLLRRVYDRDAARTWAIQWREKWETYVVRYGNGQTLNILGHGLLDWVITGGESGRRARPWHPDWVRSIRTHMHDHGKAFFHKQHGGWSPHPLDQRPAERCFADSPAGAVTLYRVGNDHVANVFDGQRWEGFPTPLRDERGRMSRHQSTPNQPATSHY